jgi:glycosyltransferase involved in cell wall biosynthesis
MLSDIFYKNNLPSISIIIPSYNQGEYLDECISSIINQEYPNLELIICDGGSSDNSVSIIKKYSSKLKFWCSELDKGQADAILKGMKYCTGDVINWLNSDDYYEPDALIKVGKAFLNKELNVFCGISRVFGMGYDKYSNGTDIYFNNLEKTIGMARIDQPETFFRRSTWTKIGGPNPNYRYLMDRELWIKYLINFGLEGILKTNEHLVNFRMHASSKTVSEQSGFDIEDKILFDSLFSYLERSSSDFDSSFSLKSIDCNKIINYRYYKKLEDAYFHNTYNEFDILSNKINSHHLSIKEKLIFYNLILRRRLLPLHLKNIYHELF